MPQLTVQEYADSSENRLELLHFLERTDTQPDSICWEKRLNHWWDENPYRDQYPYRGRVQRLGSEIVAFGGAIPTAYAWKGQPIPVLLASTLRADPAVPQAGLAILLQMRHLAQQVPLIQTTPIPRLQQVLDKMQARSEKTIQRHFYPFGWLAKLTRRQNWPAVEPGNTLITHPNQARQMERSYQKADRLEKWVTLPSLCWQLNTPTREQRFFGLTDDGGCLHSYLILTPRHRLGLRVWDILESFTTRPTFHELHALVGTLIRQPDLLPGGGHLLTSNPFPSDTTWDGTPSLHRRTAHVCHYISLPKTMRDWPKHSVLAEGDLVI